MIKIKYFIKIIFYIGYNNDESESNGGLYDGNEIESRNNQLIFKPNLEKLPVLRDE